MATSGTISSSMTARDIVQAALELLGVATAAEGGMNPDDAAMGLKHLNWMLKSWQADGCHLWRDETIDLAWPADTAECSLSPTIMDVLNIRYPESATFERPLARYERGQYATLPNKTQSGVPLTFTFHKTIGAAQVALWPVPTADVTLKADIARVTEDVTDLNQNVDLPQEWTETVFYNLADRLAGPFSVSAPDVKVRASQLFSALRDFDRPASYFLTR